MDRQVETPCPPLDVEACLREGRYHDARELTRERGPLDAWPAGRERLEAAELAFGLGALRLGDRLVRRAFREAARDPRVVLGCAWRVQVRRGAWHALVWLREHVAGLETTPAQRAGVLVFEARALAELRDFEGAWPLLDEATRLAPGAPGLFVARTVALGLADRPGEAAAVAEEGTRRHPWSQGIARARAHTLIAAGRWDEAHAVLAGQSAASQCWETLLARAEASRLLGRWAACLEDLAAARAAAMLADRGLQRLLAALEVTPFYRLGRHREAARSARRTGDSSALGFARALASRPEGAAPACVELAAVPFVRQDFNTCSPAALAEVMAFHGEKVDQAAVAAEISWLGTPDYRVRAWLERRGWRVREFDLTFDVARSLIDAGLPFILVLASATSAHSIVVRGYDELRRTLLVRDPGQPHATEIPFEAMLADQAWNGPRALALAPPPLAQRLETLVLPGVDAWEHRCRLDAALADNDVPTASAEVEALETLAPGSLHALRARLQLDVHRGEVDAQERCLDRLLTLHPGTPALILHRAGLSHDALPRPRLLRFWEERGRGSNPSLLAGWADALRLDATGSERARRLLRKALQFSPGDGNTHHIAADLLADGGDLDGRGLLHDRLAVTCGGGANEHHVLAWFERARRAGREEEVRAALARRVETAGAHASGPAITYWSACLVLGQPDPGLAALERAAELRPKDGSLAYQLVHALLDLGDPARAANWLAQAAQLPAAEAERAAAEGRLAWFNGDVATARGAFERACWASPRRADLTDRLAAFVEEMDGPEAALPIVDEAFARRPGNPVLIRQLCTRLRGRDPVRILALLDARLADHPEDAWCLRERALVLAELGRTREALAAARRGVQLHPGDTSCHGVLGHLLAEERTCPGAARVTLRRAVELDVDNSPAIRRLIEADVASQVRREDARFVLDLLAARVGGGPGLAEIPRLAAQLDRGEAGECLERLLAKAAPRAEAWDAVARARAERGETEAALRTAEEGLTRFPRSRLLLLQRARLLAAKDRPAAEREARAIVAGAPIWEDARLLLSDLLIAAGRLDEAADVVEAGLRRTPRRLRLLEDRARIAWQRGDRPGAFAASLERVADPAFDETDFRRVVSWAQTLGCLPDPEARLRRRLEAAPGDVGASLRLAYVLAVAGRRDERMAVLGDAVRRNPHDVIAIDLLAEQLALVGRWQDALKICPPVEWKGEVPVPLLGRRAWLHAKGGDTARAIEVMDEAVAAAPGYVWGRAHLVEWLEALGYDEKCLAQAEALVQAAPYTAQYHARLGALRRKMRMPSSARQPLTRAAELQPSNPQIVRTLVEFLLDELDPDAARAWIELSRAMLAPAEIVRMEILVVASEGDRVAALAAVDRLLDLNPDAAVVEAALEQLTRFRLRDAALARLEQRFAGEGRPAGAAAGLAWGHVVARRRLHRLSKLLRVRDRLDAAGRSAVASWIDTLATAKDVWSLTWIRWRFGRWLRADTGTWASVIYSLLMRRQYAVAARWAADWRSRTDLSAASLYNVMLIAWWYRRREEAEEACTRGLAPPRGGEHGGLRSFQALHLALAGDVAGAQALLAPVPASKTFWLDIAALARALLAARALGTDAASDAVRDAVKPHLEGVAWHGRNQLELWEPYGAVVDALAGGLGGPPRPDLRRSLPAIHP